MTNFSDRLEAYEEAYDYIIIKRLPIIIRIEARNFKTLVSDLEKPYDPNILDAMAHSLLYASTEINEAIFGYHFNDEINIVIRQDDQNEDAWLQNKIQKISSTASSLVTIAFNKFIQALDLELSSDAVFSSHTFAVPSITEAINYLMHRQYVCMMHSIHEASFFELSEKFSNRNAFNMLNGASFENKKQLLLEECNIDFEDYYPIAFQRGIVTYKAPTLKDRIKWIVDLDTPLFINNRDWLENIFRSGRDIFRAKDFSNDE